MMIPEAYSKELVQKKLGDLGHQARIAFGASCCERLLPNYLAFKRDVNWGNDKPLRAAIDTLWKYSYYNIESHQEVIDLISECESVAPDSEDFISPFTTYAQDAVFAVCSMLDYLSKHDIERVAQASAFAIDTIDLYVQEIESLSPNSSDLEDRIRSHPIMCREIRNQFEDIAILESGGDVEKLQSKWHFQKISNIGLSGNGTRGQT